MDGAFRGWVVVGVCVCRRVQASLSRLLLQRLCPLNSSEGRVNVSAAFVGTALGGLGP